MSNESILINQFKYLILVAAVLLPSRFAKAGQEVSQNLEIGVIVSTACTVSTEEGASGAQLRGDCPTSLRQRLTRNYVVSGETRAEGSGVTEQLVLTVLF